MKYRPTLENLIFEKVQRKLGEIKNDKGNGQSFCMGFWHDYDSELEEHKELIVYHTEKEFGVRLSEEHYERTKTIGDLVKFILLKINQRKK